MKSFNKIIFSILFCLTVIAAAISCTGSKAVYTDVTDLQDKGKITEKSGAQLWGETCNRCHLAPSPADYNDNDWTTISLHMKVRANLTENEMAKIEDFLKSAN